MTNSVNYGRRGQANPLVFGGIAVAAVVIIGIIIFAVRHHSKEVARTSTQAHIAACNAFQSQIQQEKGQLSGAGLKFDPYQSRFDEAVREQKKAEAVVDRDPHQAEQVATDAEHHFQAVLSDLQLAVQVKTDKTGTDALANARSRVADQRRLTVNYAYPGIAAIKSDTYRLDEQGYNPDSNLGAASRLLGTVEPKLEAGKPQEAASVLHEAKTECSNALRCIDVTLSSKERVEKQMNSIRSKCESADNRLEAEVQQAYFAQQFVTAASRMDSLNKLIEDRRETRELVVFCQRLSGDVGRTVDDNSDYTSPATDNEYQSLKNQLSTLSEASKQATANWADLRAQAQQLEKSLNAVKERAAQAHKDYDDALFAVKTLRNSYEDADRTANPPLSWFAQSLHPDVSNTVKDQAKELTEQQTRLERLVKQSKQDWRQIKADAEAASAKLNDLKKMHAEDMQRLDELNRQKDLLKRVTSYGRYSSTINGKTYDAGEVCRRDRDFNNHWDDASSRAEAALRAWRLRERIGFDEAMKSLKQEIGKLNSLGYYNMLRMLRDSKDMVAQRTAWSNGYRDDKSSSEWVDGFVSKRAVGANGLWEPDTTSSTGGSADFGPAPDFKAPWN